MSNPKVKAGIGVVVAAIVAVAGFTWFSAGASNAEPIDIVVYQNPACNCCHSWAEHLEQNGFRVEKHMEGVNEMKARYGIGPELAGCHTAMVEGYVVEGHVPADVIKRMLEEKPAVVGVTVPGMPMGSPGMEGPRRERYNVLTFDVDGNTEVYAER